jgi:hypothetical protein
MRALAVLGIAVTGRVRHASEIISNSDGTTTLKRPALTILLAASVPLPGFGPHDHLLNLTACGLTKPRTPAIMVAY